MATGPCRQNHGAGCPGAALRQSGTALDTPTSRRSALPGRLQRALPGVLRAARRWHLEARRLRLDSRLRGDARGRAESRSCAGSGRRPRRRHPALRSATGCSRSARPIFRVSGRSASSRASTSRPPVAARSRCASNAPAAVEETRLELIPVPYPWRTAGVAAAFFLIGALTFWRARGSRASRYVLPRDALLRAALVLLLGRPAAPDLRSARGLPDLSGARARLPAARDPGVPRGGRAPGARGCARALGRGRDRRLHHDLGLRLPAAAGARSGARHRHQRGADRDRAARALAQLSARRRAGPSPAALGAVRLLCGLRAARARGAGRARGAEPVVGVRGRVALGDRDSDLPADRDRRVTTSSTSIV